MSWGSRRLRVSEPSLSARQRQADVEAAVRIGADALVGSSALIHAIIIPQLHPDMAANLLADTRWRSRAREIG